MEATVTRSVLFGAGAFGSALLAAGAAFGQAAPSDFCGATGAVPKVHPVIAAEVFNRGDSNFDCHMWQVFIYLNWPAKPGMRGEPDPSAKFGAPGTTVWETYRTVEQTFLAGGKDPGPWNQPGLVGAAVPQSFRARVADGFLRALSRESKISRQVIANIGRGKVDQIFLNSILQAAGGVLYDQNRRPVYCEIAMNEDQYNYIQQDGLYNADTQVSFTQKEAIALPTGVTTYGKVGAIELKAAWKIVGPNDDRSRFPPPRPSSPG
jgi:hypothetical protein